HQISVGGYPAAPQLQLRDEGVIIRPHLLSHLALRQPPLFPQLFEPETCLFTQPDNLWRRNLLLAPIHSSSNEIALNHWATGRERNFQPCIVFLLPIVNIHAVRPALVDRDESP